MAVQTWVITGANRGIGLELVRQLLAAGQSVIATARDPGKAKELAELAAPGLLIEQLELENRASIDAFAARLEGKALSLIHI